MREDSPHLNDEEQLRAENDFLKMKMMLEHGAQFVGGDEDEIPAEIENVFLNNVIAFEQQYAEHKTIKIFDKLGRPSRFKPISEIPPEEIDKAWKELRDCLNEHSINLDACSPNISTTELYRFTVEELFDHEMDDIDLPGWTTNFIYDEFHPDPVYESERVIKDDFFPVLFGDDPVDEYFLCFHRNDVSINGKLYATLDDVRAAINQFKAMFTKLELKHFKIESCEVINNTKTVVSGRYKAFAVAAGIRPEELFFKGKFTIELEPDHLGYWTMKTVSIAEVSL